ncbi:unnamed protein product [Urochloa humidicola]
MDSRRIVASCLFLLLAALLSSSLQLQAQGRELSLPSSLTRDDGIELVTSRSTMVGAPACKFHWEVKTGDVYLAGTDSKITFGLYRHDLNGFTFKIDSMGTFHGNLFERGSLDAFDYDGGYCLHPCALSIHSNGVGPYPDWYVEWVRVTVSGQVSDQKTFYVNDWIGPYSPRGNDIVINDCTAAA